MRSQRGERELGLSLPPCGFLWVPPTSWLQPEANYPGSLQAQLPACSRGEQGRADAEQPCGRCAATCLQSLAGPRSSAVLRPWGRRQRSGLLGFCRLFSFCWGRQSKRKPFFTLVPAFLWRNLPVPVLPPGKARPGFCVPRLPVPLLPVSGSPLAMSTNQSRPQCSGKLSPTPCQCGLSVCRRGYLHVSLYCVSNKFLEIVPGVTTSFPGPVAQLGGSAHSLSRLWCLEDLI